MEFSDVTLLIIAGGKSSRMGRDKRFLMYGGEGLLEHLARKAAALPLAARFLCVEESSPALQEIAERYGLTLVEDGVQGRGPMEGLARGLSRIKTDYALAISCDMPFLELKELRPLLKAVEGNDFQVILPRTGRWPTALRQHSKKVSASSARSSMRCRMHSWISRMRRCSSMSTQRPTGEWPAADS